MNLSLYILWSIGYAFTIGVCHIQLTERLDFISGMITYMLLIFLWPWVLAFRIGIVIEALKKEK